MFFKAISGFVAWLAGLYILLNPWDLSSGQFLIIGLVTAIIGFIMAGVPLFPWKGKLSIIFLGLYFLGRGFGRINHQWLRFGLGIPLIFLGLWIIAQVFMERDARKSDSTSG